MRILVLFMPHSNAAHIKKAPVDLEPACRKPHKHLFLFSERVDKLCVDWV